MIYQFITFYKIVHLIWKVIYLYLNYGISTIVISYFFIFKWHLRSSIGSFLKRTMRACFKMCIGRVICDQIQKNILLFIILAVVCTSKI